MIALDSAIFIDVVNADPEFGPDALSILKMGESGVSKVLASELVYLEVLSGSKLKHSDIDKIEGLLSNASVNYHSIDIAVLREAARLRRNHKIKTPDAIHLATALLRSASHFVTNDKDLLKIEITGLVLISPSDILSLFE